MSSDVTAFHRMLPSYGAAHWQILLKGDVLTPVLENTLVTAFSGRGMFKQYLKQEKKTKRWLCKGVDVFLGASISKKLPRDPMLNVNTWIWFWASG